MKAEDINWEKVKSKTFRQTGRTFRAIIGAILAASEGKEVILLSRNHHMALDACVKAKKICDAYSLGMLTSGSQNKITFPSGGGIKFTYKEFGHHERIMIDDSYD